MKKKNHLEKEIDDNLKQNGNGQFHMEQSSILDFICLKSNILLL